MWPYFNPPTETLQKNHGFTPTQEWLDSVRLSCVRFPNGSASFISPEGLVLTNHHVGRDSIQKVSTQEHDYVRDGFVANTREEEAKIPGLALVVLASYENVTDRVKGAAPETATAAEVTTARAEMIETIQKECKEKTKLNGTVHNFYQGGEFWLYRYKSYADVRLVFAPEEQIAFFGGDPDNFTYPRYNLDFSIFRIYENGKPVSTPNYLKVNVAGPKENELVFVSGNPGNTERLLTYAQLEFKRDVELPRQLEMLRRRRDALVAYAKRGSEQAFNANTTIFGIENSIKAINGQLEGLQDDRLMEYKLAEEAYLKAAVFGGAQYHNSTIHADAAKPGLASKVGDSWDAIARTEANYVQKWPEITYSRIFGQLSNYALTIVRYGAESAKPDGERLTPFRESNSNALKGQLFTPLPVYKEMDEVILRATLELASERLGPQDRFIMAALEGKTPAEVVKNAVSKTKLEDPEFRKQLFASGAKGIEASDDPMIQLARRVDAIMRENTKWVDANVTGPEREPMAKIAAARFEVYGHTLPPDANFTLRLSPGVVKSYEQGTTIVPYKTTFFGLYERANSMDQSGPFVLPKRWGEKLGHFDLGTPFDYINTCDIIGGNSGSPIVNKNKELVGLIFDGNIQSLPGRYLYDDAFQRAVAVHPAAIVTALDKVYEATAIAKEIRGD